MKQVGGKLCCTATVDRRLRLTSGSFSADIARITHGRG
jgi:hypothetical protein